MGQCFRNRDELHRVMRCFLEKASTHAVVGPKLQSTDLIVRLIYTDPSIVVTLHLGDPSAPPGYFVTFEMDDEKAVEQHKEPHASLVQSADFAHRFWCGAEQPGIAIVNGVMKASGNYLRALVLFPHIRPLFRTYRETLEELGFTRLIPRDY